MVFFKLLWWMERNISRTLKGLFALRSLPHLHRELIQSKFWQFLIPSINSWHLHSQITVILWSCRFSRSGRITILGIFFTYWMVTLENSTKQMLRREYIYIYCNFLFSHVPFLICLQLIIWTIWLWVLWWLKSDLPMVHINISWSTNCVRTS